MAEITTKTEAISHLEAEISALKADKRKMYSASQYEATDARISRLRSVVEFIETADEPTDEATAE